MAKSTLPGGLAEELRQAAETFPSLREIAQIAVFNYADDASAAMRSGAVLLGISAVKDDKDGDGFRILIGLPRGTQIDGYLSTRFSGCVGSTT